MYISQMLFRNRCAQQMFNTYSRSPTYDLRSSCFFTCIKLSVLSKLQSGTTPPAIEEKFNKCELRAKLRKHSATLKAYELYEKLSFSVKTRGKGGGGVS